MIKSSFGFAMPKFDPAAPALRQRARRRRHPRRRLLPGVDGAADRRRGGGQAVPRAGEGGGRRRISASRGVDEWASALLHVPERHHRRGLLLGLARSRRTCCGCSAPRAGSRSADFWFACGHEGGIGRIEIDPARGHAADASRSTEPGWLYSFEADAAAEAIRAGRQEFAAPGMSWDDTLGNMRVLDKWRADAGLVYGIERAEARPRTLANAAARAAGRGDPAPAARRPRAGRPRCWRSASRTSPTSPARCDPARRLLRARRQRASTPPGSIARPHRGACSASGCARAACATRWW